MGTTTHNPFDSLESTYEYLRLLEESIDEALQTVTDDTEAARTEGADRRLQALHLVAYKLDGLKMHMLAGRRLVNDLRTLRRILLGEREGSGAGEQSRMSAAASWSDLQP